MSYAVKRYAYIFVAKVLTVVIVVRWAKPFGFVMSIAFGLMFAYLTIITGGCLGERNCEGAAPGA